MMDVRRGDDGPRVVLLQVLLNRRGAGLTVDGAYGPKTQAAVERARVELLRRGSWGRADPDLWRALFAAESVCTVDAIDYGDANFGASTRIVAALGSKTLASGAMCNGVQQVMQGINGLVRGNGSMALLRAWGHGNNGRWLTFTVGEVVHTSQADPALGRAINAERRSYVDPSNFEAMRSVLLSIKARFATPAIFEHHGCTLGSVGATRNMLQRLANLWDVPVTVGRGLQYIPFDVDAAVRFYGPTFTAWPGGTMRGWIARVVLAERGRANAAGAVCRV